MTDSDTNTTPAEQKLSLEDKLKLDFNMEVAHLRKEVIKLTHSASKSVIEILNDAETYLNWVLHGTKPGQK